MSAGETIRMAEASGIRLGVEGADLILDADLEPPVDVVNAIRHHKAEIIELLAPPGDRWLAEDWQAFFDERAGIAEFGGGQTRAEAEAIAFECCITEWMNRNPAPSESGRCAWCGGHEGLGCAIVPIGTAGAGHPWLHSDCWSVWHEHHREEAAHALATMGTTPTCQEKGVFT
jgi:hypothetical protein